MATKKKTETEDILEIEVPTEESDFDRYPREKAEGGGNDVQTPGNRTVV